MRRCAATSPGGSTDDGQLPREGARCGLPEGHDGEHSVLIPTGMPWSRVSAPPTDRQREIHTKMLAYQAEYYMPPTLRELGDLIGITSTNAVVEHLVALERRGLVKHRPGGKARGWVAINPQPQEGTAT